MHYLKHQTTFTKTHLTLIYTNSCTPYLNVLYMHATVVNLNIEVLNL